jgi:hypothetical protein
MEKKYFKKKGGVAHMGQQWDSDESSTDSSDEDTTNIAVNNGLLFPNIGDKCLMAKDDKKKRYTLEPPLNILHPMMRVALVIMKMI